MWIKMYSSSTSAISEGFSEVSSSESMTIGKLVVNTVKSISEELSSDATSKSTSVKVMNSVLNSVNEVFMKSTETTVKVVKFMMVTMTKIEETYAAYSKDDELSVNLIVDVASAMNEELDSDQVIERAALYSSMTETIMSTFESAFSTSTTNWLSMFTSSSSTVGKAYGAVASTFRKEAGTMVVEIFSAIKDGYVMSSSSSSTSSSDSGSLISSIVTAMEMIISSSSVTEEESSFNSGMLIVDVTKGIMESIMKSTTSADSGRVMTSTLESLNTDITESESSSSSSSKVDQAALFKEMVTVIKEKFESDSTVSPSAIMLTVTEAVNEQLGSSVSEETETLKMYVNTLKSVFSVYQELTSLTEKDEKDAKTIIRTLNVFSNTISSSVDAGEIAVATITALVAFSDGATFKTQVQDTIDVIKDVLRERFGQLYFNTDEGEKVSKGIKKTIRALNKPYRNQ